MISTTSTFWAHPPHPHQSKKQKKKPKGRRNKRKPRARKERLVVDAASTTHDIESSSFCFAKQKILTDASPEKGLDKRILLPDKTVPQWFSPRTSPAPHAQAPKNNCCRYLSRKIRATQIHSDPLSCRSLLLASPDKESAQTLAYNSRIKWTQRCNQSVRHKLVSTTSRAPCTAIKATIDITSWGCPFRLSSFPRSLALDHTSLDC